MEDYACMDHLTKNRRSWNMSHIKGKNTSIEVKVRKYLYHQGFRYRKNVSDLPGKPDILISKYNVVIFVNGCFWHHHYKCKLAYIPKSNTEYWKKKLEKNVENDEKDYEQLRNMGYRVLIVWECELKENFDERMDALVHEIKEDI
mgnify:CR=1 FL=1